MNKVEKVVKMVANLSKAERIIFDQKFIELMATQEGNSTKSNDRKKSAAKNKHQKKSEFKSPS
jgi:hypothetical protein